MSETTLPDTAKSPMIRWPEALVYLTVAVFIATGMILANFAPSVLTDVYLVEDGIVEWLSVVLLLALAATCLRRLITLRTLRPKLFAGGLLFLVAAFLFVAGEEVSWGQRMFEIETPDWIREHNQQGEITLHNLTIGDFSVNEVIFGNLLTLALAFYMLVLPWLAGRFDAINRLVERFALPLPTLLQSLLFFPAAFLPELLIDADQSDELVETCGLFMLLAVFLWPRNRHIFDPNLPSGGD